MELPDQETKRLVREALTAKGLEAVIAELEAKGVSQLESIKMLLRLNADLSLAEAKRAVHLSPVWSDEKANIEEFREYLAQIVSEVPSE